MQKLLAHRWVLQNLTKTPMVKVLIQGYIEVYLTASRPDIMFSVCLCAWFQASPKVSHLHVVKRAIRYIKGTVDLIYFIQKIHALSFWVIVMRILPVVELTARTQIKHANFLDIPLSLSLAKSKIVLVSPQWKWSILPRGYVVPKYCGWEKHSKILLSILKLLVFFVIVLVLLIFQKILFALSH